MSLWTADGFGSREESPCFWPRYSFIEWAKCIAQKPSLFTMAGASRIRVPTGFPHDPADGPVETVTSVLDTRPAAFSSAPQSIIQGITLPRVRCDAARHSLSLWGHVPPSCLPSAHHAPGPVAWLCASVLASVPRPAGVCGRRCHGRLCSGSCRFPRRPLDSSDGALCSTDMSQIASSFTSGSRLDRGISHASRASKEAKYRPLPWDTPQQRHWADT